MTFNFKTKSPPAILAITSLLLFVIGGPLLWIGSFAATSAPAPAWATTTLAVGFGISAIAYVLFVLCLFATIATMVRRILRAKRIRRFSEASSAA